MGDELLVLLGKLSLLHHLDVVRVPLLLDSVVHD